MLGARDEEPDNPDRQQHGGNDPQQMQGEPQTGEQQHQQQHQQYHAHVIDFSSSLSAHTAGGIPRFFETVPHGECVGLFRIVEGSDAVNHPIG